MDYVISYEVVSRLGNKPELVRCVTIKVQKSFSFATLNFFKN